MLYSDVINAGLIQPKKSKYTIRDYKKLRKAGHSVSIARFICLCSAVYHNTDWSKSLDNLQRLEVQAIFG